LRPLPNSMVTRSATWWGRSLRSRGGGDTTVC
jgi:hypothetical protein